MKKIEFIRLLETTLLLFDKVSDSNLLLKYGFSYDEIINSKKILNFIGELKG